MTRAYETGRIARGEDRTIKPTFDLLSELDLTERPAYNRDKRLAYDAFLSAQSQQRIAPALDTRLG